MANMARYEQDAFLTLITGSTRYLALMTTEPTASTAGTEVTGGSYARASITSGTWAAISGSATRQTSTNADVTFPTSSGSWGTVGWWELRDASTSGNRLAYGAFAASFSVTTGKIARVLAGNLTLKAL